MQIFQLKSLRIASIQRTCNSGYKVSEADEGLYDSREKAEEAMRQLIKDNQWSTFFAFFIYERELNPSLEEEGYGYQGVTSYYPDGTLYCESPYDVSCKKIFRGRPAKTIKLKVGDLAWYWHGDTIEPCLVFATPWTTEEHAAICQKNGVDPKTFLTTAMESITTDTTMITRFPGVFSLSPERSPNGTWIACWRPRNGGMMATRWESKALFPLRGRYLPLDFCFASFTSDTIPLRQRLRRDRRGRLLTLDDGQISNHMQFSRLQKRHHGVN